MEMEPYLSVNTQPLKVFSLEMSLKRPSLVLLESDLVAGRVTDRNVMLNGIVTRRSFF